MNAQEIQGRWDQIRGKVKERWGELTDDDLALVGGNVDQVIGRIEMKTGEARRNVENFLEDLATSGRGAPQVAKEYAQAAVDRARQGYDQVRDQARAGYEEATYLVQRHPLESVATVFALGFITGLAAGLLVKSDAWSS
jgi:uncharacterized protein YjbJ (UPF0337 family)